MRSVVITQVYNEEYLLPWWLEHHKQIFDHGVILDYASTDASKECYADLVPNWEVVSFGAGDFSAEGADRRVMEAECSFDCWKMSLNSTEFLSCHDFGAFRERLESDVNVAFAIRGAIMVDPVGEPAPQRGVPLIQQRSVGYFEDERISHSERQRSRILHRAEHGHYDLGRHRSHLPTTYHPPGALVLWFGFSPWTEEFIARKLQIKERIPESDRVRSLGKQHLVDRAELESRRLEQLALSEDLLLRTEFTEVVRP